MNLIPNLQYNSFSSVSVILRWNYITDAQNYKIYRMLYTDGSVIPTPG